MPVCAKFDPGRDPGGHAALGFRRLPEAPHTLIDPDRMPIAVALFERYALGKGRASSAFASHRARGCSDWALEWDGQSWINAFKFVTCGPDITCHRARLLASVAYV